MRSIVAVTRRILTQFALDKRTLALLFVGPLVVLWLLSMLLSADALGPKIATVDLPQEFQTQLEKTDARIEDVDMAKATDLIESNEVAGVLNMEDSDTLRIWLEGTDSAKSAAVMGVVAEALGDMRSVAIDGMEAEMDERKRDAEKALDEARANQAELKETIESVLLDMPEAMRDRIPRDLLSLADEVDDEVVGVSIEDFTLGIAQYMPIQDIEEAYLHGSSDWKMFDYYGPVFIGIFLFAFTFITSGMSLVTERSTGTMARFLATPINAGQILGGYTLAFGVLALIQSAVILWVSLTFIGFPNEGNLGLVVLTCVSMAMVSVTLGLFVSGLAHTSFQVIQLILLFVVPQILLCGLFDLSGSPGWLQALGMCMPITYGVDALRAVMLRGADFAAISTDLYVLWAFLAAFFVLAALGFRKKHAKPTTPSMRGSARL